MLSDRKPKIDKSGIVRLPFPAEIAIETHSFCNLRCIICPYVKMKRKKGKMRPELFHKIVDEVAQESPDTRLWLAIMGEPLMDRDIVSHCEYARDHCANRIHLNTNGTFLEGAPVEGLLDAGVEAIYIAIDACTEETFNKVRPGGDYNRTVRNVENLLRLRDKRGQKKPEITVQFIAMDENEHELDKFHEFWRERGAVAKIRVRQGWGSEIDTQDLYKKTLGIERFPCPWLLRTMNIHWTGRATQCDVDFEEDYPAGDVNEQTIRQVWEDDLARRRERHWNGDFGHPLCKDCLDWAAGRAEFLYPDAESERNAPRYSIGINE